MSNVFVYGTLKKGHYNNTRFGPIFGEFKGEDCVKDLAMVMTNEWYPTAVEEPDGTLIGEVWDVTDERILERVRRMELNSGYLEREVTTVGGLKAIMWVGVNNHPTLKRSSFFPLNEEA